MPLEGRHIDSRPLALVVSVRVRPGCRDAFLAGIARNAACALRDEPGCLRFDVSAVSGDPEEFWVYEVFTDEAALEAHRRTPHFTAWQKEKAHLIVPGSQVDHRAALLISEG